MNHDFKTDDAGLRWLHRKHENPTLTVFAASGTAVEAMSGDRFPESPEDSRLSSWWPGCIECSEVNNQDDQPA